MKLKNNKGITGIDITIALIVIVFFIGIVSTLVVNYVYSSKSIDRKAIATNIAISKIESLKSTSYNNLQVGTTQSYATKEGQIMPDGTTGSYPYVITTEIENYKTSIYTTDMDQTQRDALQDVIKIVNVKVEYTVRNRTQKVEIKSAIAKED